MNRMEREWYRRIKKIELGGKSLNIYAFLRRFCENPVNTFVF